MKGHFVSKYVYEEDTGL